MPKRSHSAPGPSAGYGYQIERALYWLARSPAGATVGIETDDDVAIRNGTISLLEQDKHSIADGAELVDSAIRDFIRCNIEKLRLSKEGNITDEDWRAFQAALSSRWEKIRARIIRLKQQHPLGDVGFEILTETTENYRERLAGSDTDEVYLTSGTYHLLADLMELGWHPEYAKLFKEAEEEV